MSKFHKDDDTGLDYETTDHGGRLNIRYLPMPGLAILSLSPNDRLLGKDDALELMAFFEALAADLHRKEMAVAVQKA